MHNMTSNANRSKPATQTILLVDGNALTRKLLKKCLETYGYNVHTAADGQMGFELAKREQPDLIILDIEMPVMNGIETLEKLKHEGDTKDIPVLMFSGRCGDADVARKARQLGSLDCLGKLLTSPEEFLSQVKRGLEAGK